MPGNLTACKVSKQVEFRKELHAELAIVKEDTSHILLTNQMELEIYPSNPDSPSEAAALLYELNAFEKQEYSMISLPGIYQVRGYKF